MVGCVRSFVEKEEKQQRHKLCKATGIDQRLRPDGREKNQTVDGLLLPDLEDTNESQRDDQSNCRVEVARQGQSQSVGGAWGFGRRVQSAKCNVTTAFLRCASGFPVVVFVVDTAGDTIQYQDIYSPQSQ